MPVHCKTHDFEVSSGEIFKPRDVVCQDFSSKLQLAFQETRNCSRHHFVRHGHGIVPTIWPCISQPQYAFFFKRITAFVPVQTSQSMYVRPAQIFDVALLFTQVVCLL